MKTFLGFRFFLRSLFFLWLCASCTAAASSGLPDTSKMNVLFIIIEDCYAGVWSSYGNTICKTPNLDRFSKTAVQFDRAYVQAICCNPSRSSFLTGLRPLTSRVWNNSQIMSEQLPPGTVTLPELLKRKGLTTAVIGKFFHTTEYARPQLMAFDRIEHYSPPPGWSGPAPRLKFPPVKRTEIDPAPKDRSSREYRLWRARNSDRYGDSGREPEEEGDYRMAQTAIALLEDYAKSKEQFFLSVHQSRPHTPLVAPKKYLSMYDPAKIPDPPAPPSSLKDCPYPKRMTNGNPDIFMKGQPTPQQAKEAIAAYYACVSFVDDNVGRILDALERQGLADNTVVFIMGDHGFHLGDHGFWSKYSMFEATRRAPLWVRVPGVAGNGQICREFVEFVDFVPTLCELLGLETPPQLEGVSFAPLLANPKQAWKSAVFMVQSPTEQVVRNHRYSFMEFKKGPIPAALYDLEKDPWETINLANDPSYAKARTEMAGLLQAGWKAALPRKSDKASAGGFQFRRHSMGGELPVTANLVGDYGLTALADLDRDGDLDFVLGGRGLKPPKLHWFEFRAPDRWAQHTVGIDYRSDVGLAALDVDRDGWTDLVCSGVWYRNTGKPREQEFERIVFDEKGAGAHDVLIADIDGNDAPDVVLMGDQRTQLNALTWYSIPANPRERWQARRIGPPVHGAIVPNAAVDLDGDGDLDVVRADTWFENKDGKGTAWAPHSNIPMGRSGPFGVCVRTAVADMDGDGKKEIVMADADIVDSKVVILKNADGKGGSWVKIELPQSFTYGSLHALAVADFNGDGKMDVAANEQEELLPAGRENPRWVIWENLGANKFVERIVLDAKLGGHELQAGDVDGDGDIDICSKPWGPRPWNGSGGKMHVDFLENLFKNVGLR